MKIAVLFASHSRGGKHEEIKQMLLSLNTQHSFDFIELSEIDMKPCYQCADCKDKRCEKDEFCNVLDRLVSVDVNLIIVPVYTPYPSKFVALMEKLLGVSYLIKNRPLKDKKTAIFYYCSTKICDETELKILWQKYLMDSGYSFYEPNYAYLNNVQNPNDKYNCDVTQYVKDCVLNCI